MQTLLQDLQYAARTLRKTPGFALAATLVLALGIGANTAIFSVANAVLLRGLPYKDPRSLMLLWSVGRDGDTRDQSSFTDLDDYRSQNHVFENVVPFGDWSATFIGQGDPARVPGVQVGDGYFALMGTRPFLGRDFLPEEQVEGKDNVIILSYGLWQQRFGGDHEVVGRQINLSGKPYTVVGVTAKDFTMLPATLVDGPAQFYRPVAEKHDDKERLSRHLRAVARLKPAVSMEQAQADLNQINRALAKQFPDEYSTTGIRVVSLHDDVAAGLRSTLLVLLGAIGFLLLIACANVSNLLLSRAVRRKREFALRSALGATRGQLIRQALTESILYSVCGGACGVALAYFTTQIVVALGAQVIPQLVGVSIDLRVLVFTGVVSVLTGLVFGIVPAVRSLEVNLGQALTDGARSTTTSHDLLRKGLAVAEIALALVLLAGGGLLVRTLSKLRAVDPGFRSDHLLTMDIALPTSKYPENTAKPRTFYRSLLASVDSLPGVKTAGAVSVLPLGANFDTAGAEPEGFVHGPGQTPYPERYVVTPGYFDAMKIHLLRGRFLSEADNENSPLAVLVSQTAARSWWSNRDPIGRRVKLPGFDPSPQPWRTVAGVVEDVKQAGLNAPHTMQVYLPHAQYSCQYMTLVVRTDSDPLGLTGEIRSEVAQLDHDQPVSNVASMDQVMDESVASQRFSAALLGSLAGLGLVLAIVGVYGVLSYGVTQRTREIGIRMALGATRRDVLALVVGNGLKVLLTGVAAGTVAALLVTRLMSSLLFGVSPNDPLTFVSIAVFLSAIALLASYIPARRAAKVDPMVALRYE
jgi:putative ABC transport system permease protein